MLSVHHAAVMKHLPKAKQVFDRFHIVKLLNEELNQLQRDVRWVAEMNDRKVLPNKVWLLIVHWQSPAA